MLFGGKKGGVQPVGQKWKTEKITVVKRPSPLPSRLSSSDVRSATRATTTTTTRTSTEGTASLRVPSHAYGSKKRKADSPRSLSPRKKSPVPPITPQTHWGDSDEEDEPLQQSNRNKADSVEVDPKRKLRDLNAFKTAAEGGKRKKIVHAAEVMMTKRRKASKSELKPSDGDIIDLRFPSIARKEKYV